MTQFETVKQLLDNLRKDEIRSLRRFLQLFEEGSDANQLKSMALLDLLLNRKEYPEEKVCKKIYGNHDPGTLKTFNKMLLRFKEKIYELLILDINVFRKDAHGELKMAISSVRKMLLQVNVLEGKAPAHEVMKLYEKIKQEARKYELYDELLQALTGKINFMAHWTQEGFSSETQTEILFFDRCRHSLLKARETYSRLVKQRLEMQTIPDQGTYDQAILELEHEYRYTKSAAIGHILYSLTCDYQQAIKDYDASERACQRLISLISENPSVFKNERMTRAFLDLSNIELCRARFRQAEAALQRARVYGKENPSLETSDFEITFHLRFYQGHYEKAELLARPVIDALNGTSSPWSARCYFYMAAIKTIQGKTHEALPLLQNTAELEKESLSWNCGIRLMVIINLLKAEKLDAVESHIENLRKYLDRSSKNGLISERYSLIVKLLSRLANESFDFKVLARKEKNNLDLLESQVPNLAWQPRSPELILFPLWIRAHAEQVDYSTLANAWFEGSRHASVALTLFD